MRPGLVLIGMVLAVLGAGLVVSLFFLSGGPATTTQITPHVSSMPPGANETWPIVGPSSGSGTIHVSWTSTAPADVSLWTAMACSSPSGFCPVAPTTLSWSGSESGNAQFSPATAHGYLLVVMNPGSSPMGFSGTLSLSYTSSAPVPAWVWGLIAIGGIALLIIGGIALFLGLFLPGGVYRDPDSLPPPTRHPSLTPYDPVEGDGLDDELDAPD